MSKVCKLSFSLKCLRFLSASALPFGLLIILPAKLCLMASLLVCLPSPSASLLWCRACGCLPATSRASAGKNIIIYIIRVCGVSCCVHDCHHCMHACHSPNTTPPQQCSISYITKGSPSLYACMPLPKCHSPSTMLNILYH